MSGRLWKRVLLPGQGSNPGKGLAPNKTCLYPVCGITLFFIKKYRKKSKFLVDDILV